MESANTLLVVIDPGHGGYDSGGAAMGRLEKDDNLALAREVQRELGKTGVSVLMTRADDGFAPLQDRARIANEADADLFLSLHRDSNPTGSGPDKGVEAVIYLTAPREAAGRAAELLLEELVRAGIQADRGVRRGNYYVLRKTAMPSVLLELGYIDNDEDNRLFDSRRGEYAAAIAQAVLRFFEMPVALEPLPVPKQALPPPVASLAVEKPVFVPAPLPSFEGEAEPVLFAPEPPQPSPEKQGSTLVLEAQRVLREKYGFSLEETGLFDDASRSAAIMALQSEINLVLGKSIPMDGLASDRLWSAMPAILPNSPPGLVCLLQVLLMCNGYNVGAMDGINGPGTRTAIQLFQRDAYLIPNGVAGPEMIKALLGI